jgi:hypothetical protein
MKTRHPFAAALAAFMLGGCVMYQTYDGDGNGGGYYYADQAPANDYNNYDDNGNGCDYAYCSDAGYPFGYGSFGYSPYDYSSFGYFSGYGYPYDNCYSFFGGCPYPYGYGGLIYFGGSGGYPYGLGGMGYFGYPFYSRPYIRPSVQPRPPQRPEWNNRDNHGPRPGDGQWNHSRPPYPQGEPRPGGRIPNHQRQVLQPVPSPRADDGPYNRPNVRPGPMLQPALPRRQASDEQNRPLQLQYESRTAPHMELRPENRPNTVPSQRQAPQFVPPASHAEGEFRGRPNDASERHMSLPPPRSSSSHSQPAPSHASPPRKDDKDH